LIEGAPVLGCQSARNRDPNFASKRLIPCKITAAF
jgi:hypothetical protein